MFSERENTGCYELSTPNLAAFFVFQMPPSQFVSLIQFGHAGTATAPRTNDSSLCDTLLLVGAIDAGSILTAFTICCTEPAIERHTVLQVHCPPGSVVSAGHGQLADGHLRSTPICKRTPFVSTNSYLHRYPRPHTDSGKENNEIIASLPKASFPKTNEAAIREKRPGSACLVVHKGYMCLPTRGC